LTVDVTHGDSAPEAAVVHPAGKAGAVTESKNSSHAPGVAVGVAVGVLVGVPVGVAVGVGVPQFAPVAPINWNNWSGDVVGAHVVFRTHPLPPGHAKPPPGFSKAAPSLVCTVLSVHPHWPFGLKFIFAWTDTQ
jgi:hypothetical protein